ncbi:MAG: host attachment protein [Deltaproteobacteria bacterium]|nr:host attachment protein [Deltaproteobacteria bacterium]
MSKLWIMVADSIVARIYATSARGAALQLVDSIEHPAGRLRGQDLVTDRPGTTGESTHRHSFEPHTPPVDVELDHYAKLLADKLEAGRRQESYSGLIMAMPPRLLGRVKASLSNETEKRLIETLHERLVDLTDDELRVRIAPSVPLSA